MLPDEIDAALLSVQGSVQDVIESLHETDPGRKLLEHILALLTYVTEKLSG